MKRIALALSALFAAALPLTGFASAPERPAAVARAATTSALSAASLGSYVQQKGARPDSAISGAVKVKLFNEFAQPVAKHDTAAAPDVAGFASLLPQKNPAMQGLMSAGQNNALLLNGLAARPK
ncbi:MAG: hypothetical protein FJ100_20945 [Deltaproteobacteria bacterium]|nr:hypothetical protein [Deltaproteobacteria bacterium]